MKYAVIAQSHGNPHSLWCIGVYETKEACKTHIELYQKQNPHEWTTFHVLEIP